MIQLFTFGQPLVGSPAPPNSAPLGEEPPDGFAQFLQDAGIDDSMLVATDLPVPLPAFVPPLLAPPLLAPPPLAPAVALPQPVPQGDMPLAAPAGTASPPPRGQHSLAFADPAAPPPVVASLPDVASPQEPDAALSMVPSAPTDAPLLAATGTTPPLTDGPHNPATPASSPAPAVFALRQAPVTVLPWILSPTSAPTDAPLLAATGTAPPLTDGPHSLAARASSPALAVLTAPPQPATVAVTVAVTGQPPQPAASFDPAVAPPLPTPAPDQAQAVTPAPSPPQPQTPQPTAQTPAPKADKPTQPRGQAAFDLRMQTQDPLPPTTSAPPIVQPPQTPENPAPITAHLRITPPDANPQADPTLPTQALPPADPAAMPDPVVLPQQGPALHTHSPSHQPQPHPMHSTAPPPAQQVATALANGLADAPGRIDLVLTPDDLGAVRFEMQAKGADMTIVLSAQRPETLDILRRHLPDLLAELREAGYANGSFSFGQWSGNSPRNHSASPDQPIPAAPALSDPAPLQAPRPRATPSSQGMDLRF